MPNMIEKSKSLAENLATRANAVLAFCDNFEVINDARYREADQKASETASLERGIKDYWKEPKASSYKSWKDICSKENEMLAPIKEGGTILTKKMGAYRAERNRIEREKREVEQKKIEQEMAIEAFKMEEEGVPEEAIEAVVEQSRERASIAPTQELRGKTSFTVDYEVRVIPGQEHLIPITYLIPTTSAMIKALEAKIKKLAKINGGKVVPGMEINQTQSARRRQI